MIEQQGRVGSLRPGRATVLLGSQSGCSRCDEGKGCGAGVFGRLLARKPVSLELPNHLPLRPGQAVRVGIPEGLFLRLLANFYLLPILAGLMGAALGQALAASLQFTAAGHDVLALLGALIFAALTLLIRRKRSLGFLNERSVQILGSPEAAVGLHCQWAGVKSAAARDTQGSGRLFEGSNDHHQ